MRAYTSATFTQPDQLEADLLAGERRGMQVEVNQYRSGIACAAVMVRSDRDPERRFVLACCMSADRLLDSANDVRNRLTGAARAVGAAMREPLDGA
jgi:DNA-binding IclR family transcriptional regulator